MSLRPRFLDWLEDKLQAGVGYCQGRTIFLIPKTKVEKGSDNDE